MSNLSEASRKVAIKQSLIEISNAMIQIEAHKEHIKSVVLHVSEEYEIDKPKVQQLAKMYHKQNAEVIRAKSDEVADLYESIFG